MIETETLLDRYRSVIGRYGLSLTCNLQYKKYDCFFFQAEDGIRDLVRSRGLGDVYKRQDIFGANGADYITEVLDAGSYTYRVLVIQDAGCESCLLYTSDAADERSSVDLGGRRIIKKKNKKKEKSTHQTYYSNGYVYLYLVADRRIRSMRIFIQN
mgnify:CR=1 FL=1